ncbi:FeoA family protein [Clostridium botulinum]|uniref:Iron transporter n=1 Tax=Clostridium botulinum TaxID=1491 RepID=A0A9Q1ZAD8_CLOBO|nr:FeoA domain-containing protein [Clostridium botulinum]AEB76443.1 Ferrous iron transport protein A [Clostridium botulinum BKT015925]KEI01050.1 iron transporter [Clostridium botulinum D str. 16868]KEI04769.1 iron transporter [Clostridium botulinum C/D str. Sp77]KLU75992.1 iron transporter [Clostridium botulinum V891]KOA74885.1 iron transporter [Clostridium botulinum]
MSILPLNFFVEGESGVVEDIKGDTSLFQRLSSMGFNKGATLQVVKNDLGPLIVALGGNRVAVERAIAHKIMLEPADLSYE